VQNAHPGTVNSNPGPAQAREENATPSPASSEQSLTGPASSAYGSQELATAQEFLTGSGGKQADSQQAVEWLWKSVAKRNTEATLLLARLYLRGDGVQKNCDQGRILLDIAARKGSKDAATLLQNLQAFGCP
jgi:TPR repeat protein